MIDHCRHVVPLPCVLGVSCCCDCCFCSKDVQLIIELNDERVSFDVCGALENHELRHKLILKHTSYSTHYTEHTTVLQNTVNFPPMETYEYE